MTFIISIYELFITATIPRTQTLKRQKHALIRPALQCYRSTLLRKSGVVHTQPICRRGAQGCATKAARRSRCCDRCRSAEETSSAVDTPALSHLSWRTWPCVVVVALRQQSVRIRFPCHLAGDQSAAQSRSIQDSRSRFGDGTIPLIVPPFCVIVCSLLTGDVVRRSTSASAR